MYFTASESEITSHYIFKAEMVERARPHHTLTFLDFITKTVFSAGVTTLSIKPLVTSSTSGYLHFLTIGIYYTCNCYKPSMYFPLYN